MNRHLHWFIKHPRAADLIHLFSGCIAPAKEIVESSAVARFAIRQAVSHGVGRNDGRFGVVVAGDGSTPRTAALLAASTGWQVRSWDPKLRPGRKHWKDSPDFTIRLNIVSDYASKSSRLDTDVADRWLVVHCHSHAPADSFLNPASPVVGMVSMPCCVDHFSYMTRELKLCPYDAEDVEDVPKPNNRMYAWRFATRW